MVPSVPITFGNQTDSFGTVRFIITVTLQIDPAPSEEEPSPTCGQVIGKAFRLRGIPDVAIDVVLASLADSTKKQYWGPLKRWRSYCTEKGLDYLDVTEQEVLKFLSSLFQSGASYGTLGTARAALSLIAKNDLSNNKNISRFMVGVSKLRPPKPKYDDVWDVDTVLEKISEWFPPDKLDLKLLTYRLVILLALGSAQRFQTLAAIKLSYMKKSPKGYEIRIPDRIKTSRPGACQPMLDYPYFRDNPTLCIASTIDKYIEVTKLLRKGCETLILTINKPHKPAKTDSISRWIRSTLVECGISSNFTAYSTKHASSSAALKKGASLEMIKKAACWSEKSLVFSKYYNKKIRSGQDSYARVVFNQE